MVEEGGLDGSPGGGPPRPARGGGGGGGGARRVAGLPAEGAELAGVDRVAAVVAGAVLDVLDKGLGLADLGEKEAGHVDVAHLVARSDVVDLARLALLQSEEEPAALVLDVGVVASLEPVAVERGADVAKR